MMTPTTGEPVFGLPLQSSNNGVKRVKRSLNETASWGPRRVLTPIQMWRMEY